MSTHDSLVKMITAYADGVTDIPAMALAHRHAFVFHNSLAYVFEIKSGIKSMDVDLCIHGAAKSLEAMPVKWAAVLMAGNGVTPTANDELTRLRRIEQKARKLVIETDAENAVAYADPVSAYQDLREEFVKED